MFILRFFAKIMVLPVILILSVALAIYGAADKVICLFVGAINVFYIVGIIAALLNTGEFYYVKQALVFFLLEGILLGIPQLCAEGIKQLNNKLVDFVWA